MRDEPVGSVRTAFPGCVCERQGTPRPFIPEPSRLIGHPLWLIKDGDGRLRLRVLPLPRARH